MAPPSSDNSNGAPQARAPKRRPRNFMKYPYPETERVLRLLEMVPGVTEESKRCIASLLSYRAVRTHGRFPRGQSAAVLVPLFVGRSGNLYVLLSRRSDALKAFAGDTALPGGKVDPQDLTIEDTARREAFEEVGLPQDKERLPLLCVMEPHLAKGEMLVTPVVVLILDRNLQPNLNSSEVTSIFAQPLASFLSSTPYLSGGRTADPNEPYHTFTDLPWNGSGTMRLHKFLTGREGEGVKPVFGLTASILVKTATIGYGRTPEFEVQPPNAPTPVQQIAHALLTPTNPLRIACDREGVDANKTAAQLLRPPIIANAARTTEWKKIAMGWKRLLEASNGTAKMSPADAAIDKGKESGSGDKTPGSKGLQTRVGEDAISDMEKLGTYLDKTRDMVNERMKEVKGDEKKLAEARKMYPKIMARVKKQLEGVCDEDGELNPKNLLTVIPKEGWEGVKGGIDVGKEGIKRGKGHVGDGQGGDEDVKRGEETIRRHPEEKYTCKGDDGHNPEQSLHRKCNSKL